MSRFPDFMHMDLSKVTCSGCFLILLSFLVAFGTAIGGGFLTMWLFSGWFDQGKLDRWMVGLFLIVGLAVGGGFFQFGALIFRRIGLRLYRECHEPSA